ncbi:hypothetical protein KIH39_17795 [Telmatocola sphagniphila]|uniref:Uncharacterized protein n=1 Tax=Telmatocola sphagniphila TaxID=1123043 RepID=A0A8E6EU20_9BACT|nr:hypothetical protein [Telmatocola sphagniphila]QVL30697.1 hypothetical protein KIH39_17795 [Telmatocola sphagniphila]
MGAIAEGIVAYAKPLLDQTDGSPEQIEKAFAIAQLCYNLAIFPEDSWEKTLSDVQKSFAMNDEEFDAFKKSVIMPMIQRHHEMFPFLHRRASAGPSLSGPSEQELPKRGAPAQRISNIDRYAPCACNSGKKYKFCCGAKGR